MSKVYIIATYTGTALARVIRKISHTPYSHISISLNEELKPMYAFGRLYPRTPIFAGLVEENINEGLYALKKNTECRVYELEVSEKEYALIKQNLYSKWNKRKSLKYDTRGLAMLALNKPRVRENKYVCSNFVSHVLEESGVKIFTKPYYEIQPIDFIYNSSGLNLTYEGLLSEYKPNHSLDNTKLVNN